MSAVATALSSTSVASWNFSDFGYDGNNDVDGNGAYEQVAGAYGLSLHAQLEQGLGAPKQLPEQRDGCVDGGVSRASGNLHRSSNIGISLSQFLTRDVPKLTITNETHTIGPKEKLNWIVDLTFNFAGNSTILGKVSGIIAANCSFTDNDSSWLISREVWNFLEYDAQYPPG